MDESKESFPCSPRRKIDAARARDREIAAQLEADAKESTDDAAQSKDAKEAYGAKGGDGSSIDDFSFDFVRRIIDSAPGPRR